MNATFAQIWTNNGRGSGHSIRVWPVMQENSTPC